jgi:hypothetical protein
MHLNKFAFAFAGLMMFSSVAFAQDAAVAPAEVAPTPAAAPAAPAAPKDGNSWIKDVNDITGATAMLQQVDKNHNPFQDQWIKTNMVLNGGVHKNVEYKFDTYTKGKNRRSVRFYAPAEMRGMGVVTKGRDEVYARLPDSQKVRRVGTHAKRQSFYGSDWAMDDMSMIYMAEDYDVVKIVDLNANGGTHVVLDLKLKAGVDSFGVVFPRAVNLSVKRIFFVGIKSCLLEALFGLHVIEHTHPACACRVTLIVNIRL